MLLGLLVALRVVHGDVQIARGLGTRALIQDLHRLSSSNIHLLFSYCKILRQKQYTSIDLDKNGYLLLRVSHFLDDLLFHFKKVHEHIEKLEVLLWRCERIDLSKKEPMKCN